MNIGQAAAASGVSAKRIRYYEKVGLVEPAPRSEAGYRVYANQDVHTLGFISQARRLGFSITQIDALLALWRDKDRSSAEVKTIALKHVAELRDKIDEIQSIVDTITDLATRCDGDDRPDCPILVGLQGCPS